MKLNLIHILYISLLLSSCFKEDETPLPGAVKFIEGKWEFDHFKMNIKTVGYYNSKNMVIKVSKKFMVDSCKFEFEIKDHNIYFSIDDKDSAKATFDILSDNSELINGKRFYFIDLELDNENDTKIQFIYDEEAKIVSTSYKFTRVDKSKNLGPHIYYYGSENLYFKRK